MATVNPGGAAFFSFDGSWAGSKAPGLFFFLLLSACAHNPVPIIKKDVTILYQSNRFGELEPCGCQKKPYGGIDREANAVSAARREGRAVWYVDAGNLLGPETEKLSLDHRRRKARALAGMLKEMKLDVLFPGPSDYALGVDFLRELSRESGVAFVGGSFPRYHIGDRAGLRVAFLAAEELSVKETVSELAGKADMVVALSQLGAEKDELLAKQIPEIHVIIGADPNVALEKPFLIEGRTLQADAHRYGYQIGKLAIDLQLPFRGFSSPEEIAANRARLADWQARLAADPDNRIAAEYIDKIQREEVLSASEGGSTYRNELISLDAERFGKKNSITEKIQAYRAAVRAAALAE